MLVADAAYTSFGDLRAGRLAAGVYEPILDWLDAPIPDRIQGISYRPLIEGRVTAPPRQAVYGQFTPAMKRDNESRCILTERYQLIWYSQAGRTMYVRACTARTHSSPASFDAP